MRAIDADALKYRRMEYGAHDDVPMDERKNGILYLLKEDIDDAPTVDAVPVSDHYEILLAEKAQSWKEGFDAGIKAERQHNESEKLARNGYQEDEWNEDEAD